MNPKAALLHRQRAGVPLAAGADYLLRQGIFKLLAIKDSDDPSPAS
jgi:hypothetical protein